MCSTFDAPEFYTNVHHHNFEVLRPGGCSPERSKRQRIRHERESLCSSSRIRSMLSARGIVFRCMVVVFFICVAYLFHPPTLICERV